MHRAVAQFMWNFKVPKYILGCYTFHKYMQHFLSVILDRAYSKWTIEFHIPNYTYNYSLMETLNEWMVKMNTLGKSYKTLNEQIEWTSCRRFIQDPLGVKWHPIRYTHAWFYIVHYPSYSYLIDLLQRISITRSFVAWIITGN